MRWLTGKTKVIAFLMLGIILASCVPLTPLAPAASPGATGQATAALPTSRPSATVRSPASPSPIVPVSTPTATPAPATVVVATSAGPTQASACGAGPTPSASLTPAVAPSGLYVDDAITLGTVNRQVFSALYDPAAVMDNIQQALMMQARPALLRFPLEVYGNGQEIESGQITEFLKQCSLLKSEPSLGVRLSEGPAAAVALLNYVNQPGNLHARYWSIGNEPDRSALDSATFNAQWRAIAQALKAAEPGIQLVGPELSFFTNEPERNPKDAAGLDWMEAFLQFNGDLVDVISIHLPYPGTLDNNAEAEAALDYLRTLVFQVTGRKIPLAVSAITPVPGMAIPLPVLGDLLGRFTRQGLSFTSPLPILGEGPAVVTNSGRASFAPVYRLYSQLGTEAVYTASDQAEVSVYASRLANGAVTIVLVNLASEARSLPLTLERWGTPLKVTRITASPEAALQSEAITLDNGKELSLPAQSLTMLLVKT